MAQVPEAVRIPTGVPNLDPMLHGGLLQNSITIICGPPGSGKTVLAQQICCHNLADDHRVLYFNTLSEPSIKVLQYLRQFRYFDPACLDRTFFLADIGETLQRSGLEATFAFILSEVKRVRPAFVVIDSFKVFNEAAKSKDEFRRFGYQIMVNLMVWGITGILVGEYTAPEQQDNPAFALADNILILSQAEVGGEQQRLLQVAKQRGSGHSLDEEPFTITQAGIAVYALRQTLKREKRGAQRPVPLERLLTGISKLDDLLGDGIPLGSSVLVTGVAGTGKTVMLLEFIYRGAARFQQPGLLISFEETRERLLATAQALGMDLQPFIAQGLVEVLYISPSDIALDANTLMIESKVQAMGAKRIALDSSSLFLHRLDTRTLVQERMFQLTSIVHNADAVGFIASDIPYGTPQISRWGVEETIADGVIVLSAMVEGIERQRYIEVYKMRNTAHLKGRHDMVVGRHGIEIYPRYLGTPEQMLTLTPSPDAGKRLPSGVPGLDAVLHGGWLTGSVTLLTGSPGSGKSTMALQFLLEGAARQEQGILLTLEFPPSQVLTKAEAMGLPLRQAVSQGLIKIQYLQRESIRSGQFLSVITDQIGEHQVKRLAFDDVDFIQMPALAPNERGFLLHSLGVRFKSMGVTSLFTLTSALYGPLPEQIQNALMPLSDNLASLRLEAQGDRLTPLLTVIKTGGSLHDWRAHACSLGHGGLRVANPLTDLGFSGQTAA
jgi:circadian clock protein KaiC